jgi:Fe2+ or Zn2+ uptake regulation protein
LQGRLPAGFRLEKFNVEVHGTCKACATTEKRH